MKPINWTEVQESTGSTMLEPGAYVCRITDVHDVPSKEYIEVVYDVIEGPKAGIYANMGPDDEWKHRFFQSYKDTAKGMFKAFYTRIQESNPGFMWNGTDERQFIGKEIGLLFRKEYYTGNDGADKERTVVDYAICSQDVRSGNFKVREPNDRRDDKSVPFGEARPYVAPAPMTGAYSPNGQTMDYSDVPFM